MMSLVKLSYRLYHPATRGKLFIRNFAVNSSNVKVESENGLPKNLKSWKQIPGPASLPFIGSMWAFIPWIGSIGIMQDSYDFIKAFHKYGPLVRFSGGLGTPPSIFVYDIDSIEQILRSENTRMPERPGFPSLEYFRKTYSKDKNFSGLITEHGEKWKSFRSIVNPVMLQPKTIKLYSEELDKVASDMIKRIRSIRNEKNMLTEDFEIELNKWALESIGVVALGGRIGCLSGELLDDSPERQLIQCVRDTFSYADKLDNRPGIWRFVETATFRKGMAIYEEQIRLAKHFINKAMKEYEKRDTEIEPENKGVLEKLLKVDENVAITMASDMLFAGVDTTAHTMLGTLYILGSNPEKQAILRKEILSTTTGDRRPYLKACLKESMRLMVVVAGNLRRTTKDYELLGYHIPKGMNLIFPHEYLSRQDDQYPKAKEFHPERWIVNKDDPMHYGHAHPLTTAPFGFGVRSCIGRRIAELEIETFTARMVENFQIEWFGPPPKRKATAISYVLPPYNFILKDVNQ